LAAGCAEPTITVSYLRPARYRLPPRVRNVAVVPFDVLEGPDELGGLVADVLADRVLATPGDEQAALRFQEVKRLRRPGKVADASDAVEIGRSSGADALIRGWVEARAAREDRSRISVSVSFKVEDSATAGTILALTIARQGRATQSEAKAMADLCRQCVRQFVEAITPQAVRSAVRLEAGQSRAVRKGNGLAATGEYRRAMDCYGNALDDNPCDAGAMFNAGVMCELAGDMAAAERHYAAAAELCPKDKFREAMERVSSLPGR